MCFIAQTPLTDLFLGSGFLDCDFLLALDNNQVFMLFSLILSVSPRNLTTAVDPSRDIWSYILVAPFFTLSNFPRES